MTFLAEKPYPTFSPWIMLLVVIFFIPIQTNLFEGMSILGVKPDLGFILSYLIGLAWGRTRGLLWGILFGGLQDIFSIGAIGPHCLLKGLIGLGAGLLETFYIYLSLRAHTLVSFLASLLHELIGVIFFYGTLNGLMALSWFTIGHALYNCAITTGLLFILSRPLGTGHSWINKGSR